MMHDPWTDKLSEYLDGDLDAAERAALERHLAACPACRTTLADLRRVVERARTLPAPAPAADLWAGIARRIGERAPSATRPWHRVTFSLPQLAAATIVAAVASGAGGWWLATRAPDRPALPPGQPAAVSPAPAPLTQAAWRTAEPKYAAAVEDLERVLAQGRSTLDSATVAVLERNLRVIDGAIADARRALAGDPGNTYLNAHLARTMRRKIDLLRQAASLAVRQS
ncbi:MAG TPA: anti-sigma factor [Gemmatimonadales bacterium]|nr:anti-sigma factor [Gemmatimonadales bacterium]